MPLILFQRCPQYSFSMRNAKFIYAGRAASRARYPRLKQLVQTTFGGFDYDLEGRAYVDLIAEQPQEAFKACWADGSLGFCVGNFQEIIFDREIDLEISTLVREKTCAGVTDPDIADKLMPSTYGFGLPRVPQETEYFEAYNRANVAFIDIYGRVDGASTEGCQQDIRMTLSSQVHCSPNLIYSAGPSAPETVLRSMTTCFHQIERVGDCIDYLRNQGHNGVEPTVEKGIRWVEQHDVVAKQTLVVETNTWYMGSNVNGRPNRLPSHIGGVYAYRQKCEEAEPAYTID